MHHCSAKKDIERPLLHQLCSTGWNEIHRLRLSLELRLARFYLVQILVLNIYRLFRFNLPSVQTPISIEGRCCGFTPLLFELSPS